MEENIHTTTPEQRRPENSTIAPAVRRRTSGHLKTIVLTLLVALFLKSFVVEAFRIPSSSMEGTLHVGDFLLVNKMAYGIRTPRYVPLTNLAIPTVFVPVFRSVRRGDVVVFEFPGPAEVSEEGEPLNYIKRCIGLPGDVVEIRDGRVYVNNLPLTLPKNAKVGERARGAHRSRARLYPRGAGFTEDRYGPLPVPRKGDRIELKPSNLSIWRPLLAKEGHRLEIGEGGTVTVDGVPTSTYTIKRNYYFVLGDNRDNSLDSRYWGFVPEENLIGEALFVYWSWDPDVAVTDFWQKIKSIRWNRIGTLIR